GAIAKRPAAAFKPFPEPKRGMDRVQGKRGKEKGNAPYVRTANGTQKTQKERNAWCRNTDSFDSEDEKKLVDLLIKDGVLIDWSGSTCPFCGKGTLGERCTLDWGSGSGCAWRCNDGKKCGKQMRPTRSHPIFASGWGKETLSLRDKCRVSFGLLTGMTTAQMHQHYGTNHKMIEKMTSNLDIAYGSGKTWVDIEADGSVFASAVTEDKEMKEWEQWAGVVQRGKPETPVLFRAIAARSGSAQWEHWHRGHDLWSATGEMLCDLMGPTLCGHWRWLAAHSSSDSRRAAPSCQAFASSLRWRPLSDMASPTAGNIKSIGEAVGSDASATDQIKNTRLDMAAVQSFKKLDKPELFHSDPPAAFALRDMPLQYVGHAVNLKHSVDWVALEDGAAEQLDTVDVHGAMCAGNYMALPIPFKPNKDPCELAFTAQLHILPKDANGEQHALKYARFENKVRTDIAKEIFVAGKALAIHWGSTADKYTPLKLFYHMVDRLGGAQIHHWAQPSAAAAAVGGGGYDRGRRRAGYRFIEEFGPRANNRNLFAGWTDEQVNDEQSPIFGRQAAEVKESLRNYASGSVGARTLERWAVTLERPHPFAFDNIVAPILKSHDVHGTMWIGKTMVGESTASKTIGFAISAYRIDENSRADLRPSVVTTKKIDFLRLEPGTAFKPDIADDTAHTKWAPDEIKAFLDPAEEDALLWGGTSFEQNQPRQICVNPYDQEFEKKARSIRRGQQVIKFDDFLKIIDRNFMGEKQSGYQMADVEAYLARSNIVLLTDDWMYLWLASTTKDPAPRFPRPVPEKPDLFAPWTTPILKRFKKGQAFTPPDYDAHTKRAAAATKKLAGGKDAGRSKTIHNSRPHALRPGNPDDDDDDFGPGSEMGSAAAADDEHDVFGVGGGTDGDDDPPPAAVAAAIPSPAAAIKSEPGAFLQRLKKSKDCGVIDLSTPTPKKKRMDLEEELSQMLDDDGTTGAAAASSGAGAPA
ncbi:unnamed protein product, partial [Prorocentrum cordatum]